MACTPVKLCVQAGAGLALTRLSLTFASRLVDARTTIFLDQYALDVDDDQVLSLPV